MLIIYVIDMTANENVKTCFSSFGYANSDFLVGYALLLVKKKAKRLALVGLRVWLFFFFYLVKTSKILTACIHYRRYRTVKQPFPFIFNVRKAMRSSV